MGSANNVTSSDKNGHSDKEVIPMSPKDHRAAPKGRRVAPKGHCVASKGHRVAPNSYDVTANSDDVTSNRMRGVILSCRQNKILTVLIAVLAAIFFAACTNIILYIMHIYGGDTINISGTTNAISGTTDAISGTTDAISGTTDSISGTTDSISGNIDAIIGTTDGISSTIVPYSTTPDCPPVSPAPQVLQPTLKTGRVTFNRDDFTIPDWDEFMTFKVSQLGCDSILPYTRTQDPNRILQNHLPFLEHFEKAYFLSNCSDLAPVFGCLLLYPYYNADGILLKPCYNLCKEVYDHCKTCTTDKMFEKIKRCDFPRTEDPDQCVMAYYVQNVIHNDEGN